MEASAGDPPRVLRSLKLEKNEVLSEAKNLPRSENVATFTHPPAA